MLTLMKPKVKPRILGLILGRNVAGPESPSSDSPPPHTHTPAGWGGGGPFSRTTQHGRATGLWQQAVEAAREECLGGIYEKKIAIPKELSEHYTDFEYDELDTDQVTAVYIKEELTLYVVGFVNSVKRLNKILHKSVEEELAEIS